MKKALMIIYLLSILAIFAGCAGQGFVLWRMEAAMMASIETVYTAENISQELEGIRSVYIEEMAAVIETTPAPKPEPVERVRAAQIDIFAEFATLTANVVEMYMIGGNVTQNTENVYIEDEPKEIAGHIAITFDDGPHETLTPLLLDALEERGVRATFFLLGLAVDRHPEIVARMYEEGHSIGNHSYRHPRFTIIGRQRVIDEIESTNRSIYAATGSAPTLLRPPYGEFNTSVLEIARDMDMSVVMWSVDPRDWEHRNATIVRDNILGSATDGSVVLLHDIHETSIEAAIMVIDELLERGYVFVTVEELFELSELTLQAGEVYRSVYRSLGVTQ